MPKMDHFFIHSSREVFILRFWLAGMDRGGIKGSIQHVNSQKTCPLDDPEALLRLLLEQMGLADTSARESSLK